MGRKPRVEALKFKSTLLPEDLPDTDTISLPEAVAWLSGLPVEQAEANVLLTPDERCQALLSGRRYKSAGFWLQVLSEVIRDNEHTGRWDWSTIEFITERKFARHDSQRVRNEHRLIQIVERVAAKTGESPQQLLDQLLPIRRSETDRIWAIRGALLDLVSNLESVVSEETLLRIRSGLKPDQAIPEKLHLSLSCNAVFFRTDNAIALLDELEPSDGPEAMLTAQMVAVHLAAMDCLARALHPSQSFAGRELNLKHGANLFRIVLTTVVFIVAVVVSVASYFGARGNYPEWFGSSYQKEWCDDQYDNEYYKHDRSEKVCSARWAELDAARDAELASRPENFVLITIEPSTLEPGVKKFADDCSEEYPFAILVRNNSDMAMTETSIDVSVREKGTTKVAKFRGRGFGGQLSDDWTDAEDTKTVRIERIILPNSADGYCWRFPPQIFLNFDPEASYVFKVELSEKTKFAEPEDWMYEELGVSK